ncbi:HD domain-containing protein [Candidatus Harpocratesius sp.]
MNFFKKKKISSDLKSKIFNFVKNYYDFSNDLHGWGHIQRVWSNCRKIIANLDKKEDVQLDLLELAVYLHDIGRKQEKLSNKNHALLSADLSTQFLTSHSIPEPIINAINHIIISHSFSLGKRAQTLEAQILSDADKLDALGSVGIYRVCAYQTLHGGNIQSIISHCDEKLLILKEKLYLDASKKIATPLINRIRQFKENLLEELRF